MQSELKRLRCFLLPPHHRLLKRGGGRGASRIGAIARSGNHPPLDGYGDSLAIAEDERFARAASLSFWMSLSSAFRFSSFL